MRNEDYITILNQIKNAKSDDEKINLILQIQDDRNDELKEKAIYLLQDDKTKLLMAEKLGSEIAKTRIYMSIIKKGEMVDEIIDSAKKLKQINAVEVFCRIPDGDYKKKINAIADVFINTSKGDDASREKVASRLKRIYSKMHRANSEFTYIDFLKILENDYTIASVITNVANPEEIDEFEGIRPIDGLPTTLEDRKKLIGIIQDETIREQVGLIYSSKDELINKLNLNDVSQIGLPEDMTIGVELEAEGILSVIFNGLTICDNWIAKGDDSLENGIEIVSPILHDTEEDMRSLAIVSHVMRECKLTANENCGGHIHIGAQYLDTVDSLRNFLLLWLANEKEVYEMCNPSGENFRNGTSRYAKPVSILYESVEEDIYFKIANAKTREELVIIIQKYLKGHFNGLNLDNINDEEKDTIEFRMSNGTLDFREIQNNIRLYGRLMQRSKEISEIKKKFTLGQQLSESEMKEISGFEDLCSPHQEVSKRGHALADFLFEESERDTYMSRYESHRGDTESFKKLFDLNAYKKLYTALKEKDKRFSGAIKVLNGSEDEKKKEGITHEQ